MFYQRGECMKTEKNILVAFLLNLAFSIFEFFGGIFCGSVAIQSDAIHDIGDAASIGISYFLEKKSKRAADEKYTYGYARFSVLGGVITTMILLLGSVAVAFYAIKRIIRPIEINYDGMLLFAVVGVCVNFAAAMLTHKGHSLNEKAINLHMLEDVLGWVVVLVGAIVMRFTDIAILDPLMSLGVSVFILINAARNLKVALEVFLEKTPQGIELEEVEQRILAIEGVIGVHHIHIWSFDGRRSCATMHIVTNSDSLAVKKKTREELRDVGISHATIELEAEGEMCEENHCLVKTCDRSAHSHHH